VVGGDQQGAARQAGLVQQRTEEAQVVHRPGLVELV
jgi:hypothetical protein